jgi:DegV family protein with EDD domain
VNRIAVCTDSSALLPVLDAERLGIEVLTIAVTVDGAPFDEREHSVDDFYEWLAGGARATTSQPSPGDFLQVYERAAARGAREALSVHLDGRASGTTGSAELAARAASIPVTVIDTGTVSFGVGVCVRAAAEAVAAGMSASDAGAVVMRLGSSMRNVFGVRGGPGGRVPGAPGWAVLTFAGGSAQPVAGSDSSEAAIEAMRAQVLARGGPLRAAVGHAAAATEPAADALAAALADSREVDGVERYRVGPAVGAHTGPFSFGAFWWPSPP